MAAMSDHENRGLGMTPFPPVSELTAAMKQADLIFLQLLVCLASPGPRLDVVFLQINGWRWGWER